MGARCVRHNVVQRATELSCAELDAHELDLSDVPFVIFCDFLYEGKDHTLVDQSQGPVGHEFEQRRPAGGKLDGNGNDCLSAHRSKRKKSDQPVVFAAPAHEVKCQGFEIYGSGSSHELRPRAGDVAVVPNVKDGGNLRPAD